MVTQIKTAAINGIDSRIINVETDISSGLPGMEIIGSLSNEVREAKERVRVALKNNGISIPPARITINLSPAHIKKEGTGYDLPIAVSLLIGLGEIKNFNEQEFLFSGELGLDGEIKGIKGILPMILEAKKNGIKTCVIPKDNAKEGAVVSDIKIIGVRNIAELIIYLNSSFDMRDHVISPEPFDVKAIFDNERFLYGLDFSDVCGQEAVKRAMEIAASGFHNILVIGPPGSGKSMMAQRLPTILPPLTFDESMEVSKIYSVCGLLNDNQNYVSRRPYLSPHHSISQAAMAGGGRVPTPGIISRAHKGVLFLDEIVHFPTNTLEVLRQPIEEKCINVSRANWNYTFPSDFMLVAAMNPCPCGHYPNRNKCNCTPEQIKQYISKISGPILDRFDICVEAGKIDINDVNKKGSTTSEEIRKKVLECLDIQKERYANCNITFNSQLSSSNINEFVSLGKEELSYAEEIYKKLGLSVRGYHRILKVSRTIADLDNSGDVKKKHLLEAVSYRSIEDKYWGRM